MLLCKPDAATLLADEPRAKCSTMPTNHTAVSLRVLIKMDRSEISDFTVPKNKNPAHCAGFQRRAMPARRLSRGRSESVPSRHERTVGTAERRPHGRHRADAKHCDQRDDQRVFDRCRPGSIEVNPQSKCKHWRASTAPLQPAAFYCDCRPPPVLSPVIFAKLMGGACSRIESSGEPAPREQITPALQKTDGAVRRHWHDAMRSFRDSSCGYSVTCEQVGGCCVRLSGRSTPARNAATALVALALSCASWSTIAQF